MKSLSSVGLCKGMFNGCLQLRRDQVREGKKQTKCHGQTINVYYYDQNKNTLEWENKISS